MESIREMAPKVAEELTEATKKATTESRTSSCTDCGGTGWKQVELEGPRGKYMASKRCECRYEAIIQFQLPQLYHAAMLKDFPQTLRSIITEWLDEATRPNGQPRPAGLFLCGHPGTGKTHLAASIVRRVISMGKSIRFRRAAQLYQAIRDSYGNDSVSEAEVLADFVDAPLLVLDDLGTGSLSDHERRYTLEVLDSRLNANRPTIITSNLTIEQIRDAMDDRIASRLNTFKLISFNGQDRRKGRKSA